MRHLMLITTMALALCAGGCATLSSPKPDPGTPQTDERQLAINSAGDLGGLGCGVLATELKPEELQKARKATTAARELMKDQPSFSALGDIINEAGLPFRYTYLSTVILHRVRVRIGQADVIPTGTTGYAMVEAYLDACGAALNAFPTAKRSETWESFCRRLDAADSPGACMAAVSTGTAHALVPRAARRDDAL